MFVGKAENSTLVRALSCMSGASVNKPANMRVSVRRADPGSGKTQTRWVLLKVWYSLPDLKPC
jgi:hypothetical protein